MLGPSIIVVAAVGTIVFFWRVGEAEYGGSPVPAFISLGLWLVGIFVLHFGLLLCLVLQAALFLALTLYNIKRDPL